MGGFGWIRQLAGLPVRVYCTDVVFEDVFTVLIDVWAWYLRYYPLILNCW